MKHGVQLVIIAMSILSAAPALATNPFLDAKDDKPASANFRGQEWSDENTNGEIPLTARVITTRVAQMSWGAIFRIEFVDLKSRAKEKREILPIYFIATDDRIVLFDISPYVEVESGLQTTQQVKADYDAAVKKISAMEKAPGFEQRDVRAITSGEFNYEEPPWTTTIKIKGNECIYETSHNSGHYQRFIWKKGVGLVDHASNYGAARDGFRLKRVSAKG